MFSARELSKEEIPLIWTIDRAEVIDNIYYLVDGVLELHPEHYDMPGWPPDEDVKYMSLMVECFDYGGWFYGVFDGDKLIGVVVLENRWIGRDGDKLQLKFLHVSHAYRKQGWGKRLFELAADEARRRGARRLYISATPSENTVKFYIGLGCMLASEVDPELFELEPEDIHLEYYIS